MLFYHPKINYYYWWWDFKSDSAYNLKKKLNPLYFISAHKIIPAISHLKKICSVKEKHFLLKRALFKHTVQKIFKINVTFDIFYKNGQHASLLNWLNLLL